MLEVFKSINIETEKFINANRLIRMIEEKRILEILVLSENGTCFSLTEINHFGKV